MFRVARVAGAFIGWISLEVDEITTINSQADRTGRWQAMVSRCWPWVWSTAKRCHGSHWLLQTQALRLFPSAWLALACTHMWSTPFSDGSSIYGSYSDCSSEKLWILGKWIEHGRAFEMYRQIVSTEQLKTLFGWHNIEVLWHYWARCWICSSMRYGFTFQRTALQCFSCIDKKILCIVTLQPISNLWI